MLSLKKCVETLRELRLKLIYILIQNLRCVFAVNCKPAIYDAVNIKKIIAIILPPYCMHNYYYTLVDVLFHSLINKHFELT